MTTQVLNQNTSSRQTKSVEANACISALANILSSRETMTDIDLSDFSSNKQQQFDPDQSEFDALNSFLGMIGLTR